MQGKTNSLTTIFLWFLWTFTLNFKCFKKQIEDIWTLIQMKEKKISQIKERKRFEEAREQLTSQIEELEPTLKQTTGLAKFSHTRNSLLSVCINLYLDTLNTVTPKVKELAEGLDIYRHQIRLIDINEFKKEKTDELIQVFKKSTTLSEDIEVGKFDEVIKAANVISDLDSTTAMQIGIMEE